MNTEILKSKILDLLIKGELTAKWREDHKNTERAEVLLEKIRSEKEKKLNDELVAKGKKPNAKVEIKEVEENDKPFEIPSSWKWCRLGDIVISMNDGPFGSDLKKEHYTEKKEARIIQLSNIGEGGWKEENTKYTTFEHAKEIPRSIVEPGNIVIAKMMPAGRAIICPNHEKMYVLSSDSIKVIQSQRINTEYLFYLFNSEFVRTSIAKTTKGTTRARTNIGSLRNILLPLPPLEEQKELSRIADSLLSMVNTVDASYTNLETLSKTAKVKVLDLLIKGELTSKWRESHKDIESAEVLLEKIRSEKEKKLNDELVAKGKKPTANVELKEIAENDKPFEIPSNWKWCHVGDVIDLLSGRDLEPQYYNSEKNGIPYMTGASNFNNNCLLINRWTPQPATISKKGDLLITCKGTVGLLAFNTIGEIHIARQIMAMQSDNTSILSYLFIFFLCHTSKVQNHAGGVIPGFDRNFLLNTLLPLPPLEEQRELARIVDYLLNQIDSLTDKKSTQTGDEENE